MVKKIQLGKKGITDNFLSSLKTYFKNSKNVKISVLKSCCRDKKELKQITQEIKDNLDGEYSSRTIGYTIAMKKLRNSKHL